MDKHSLSGRDQTACLAETAQLAKYRTYYPALPKQARTAKDYFTRLFRLRLDLIRSSYHGGTILDLCCGDGEYLPEVAAFADKLLAVDFTPEALADARERSEQHQLSNVEFIESNARKTPIESQSVELAYCFSSLYAIPRSDEVVSEIARVLVPGGTAVLDFGVRQSLNTFVVKAHPESAAPHHLSLRAIRSLLNECGFEITEHRAFQILPLWGSRPAWLRPLLHPVWKKILSTQVRNVMLDEWISSLPVLRQFAFRHLITCRKRIQE